MSSETPAVAMNFTRDAASPPRFFMSMHAVLLLAVLIGFAHTFYLRPLFSTRPLPSILYVHGAVLTVWFLLTVLQGWLVLTQRVALHRRTGYVVATYAALVVVMGVAADLRLVA